VTRQLPISPQSYLPTPEVLMRALLSSEVTLARTIAQETQLDGATAFTNPRLPWVQMANCARMVHLPPGVRAAAVVDGVLAHFANCGVTCHQFQSAAATWPAELAQEIEQHGYHLGAECVLQLLGKYQPPKHALAELQVIPGRAAYDEVAALARDSAANRWHGDPDQCAQFAAAHVAHLDEPRLESFLGRVDGKPAGIVDVLSVGTVGVIDWVYVTPAMRRRGVASRLLDDALDYCRRAQFAQVILETQRGSEAISLCKALGFAPVAAQHAYVRD
jgi:GNAT superfamily N-acetyltransferase